jgi:hypothetical protein
MNEVFVWVEYYAALESVSRALRWFTVGVGVCFVYYVVYSLRRLRKNLHYIANSLQIVLGDRELRELKRQYDAEARRDAHYTPASPRGPH